MDAEWTADGYVSDRWLPVSPVSGRLDAFAWRVPLTGIVNMAPMIEPEPPPAAPIELASDERKSEQEPRVTQDVTQDLTPAVEDAAAMPTRRRIKRPQLKSEPILEPKLETKPEPIIPLVHPPDDPGPDAVEEGEPSPEPQSGGWRKILE
jgi:HemY protein